MNKSELSELKKLYTQKKCSVQRIAGCFVDGDKNKKSTFNRSFLGIPEEEMFKYFDGEISLEEAIRQIQSHTREYARKQLTWYKKDEKMKWFNLSDEKVTTDNIKIELISIIRLLEQEC